MLALPGLPSPIPWFCVDVRSPALSTPPNRSPLGWAPVRRSVHTRSPTLATPTFAAPDRRTATVGTPDTRSPDAGSVRRLEVRMSGSTAYRSPLFRSAPRRRYIILFFYDFYKLFEIQEILLSRAKARTPGSRSTRFRSPCPCSPLSLSPHPCSPTRLAPASRTHRPCALRSCLDHPSALRVSELLPAAFRFFLAGEIHRGPVGRSVPNTLIKHPLGVEPGTRLPKTNALTTTPWPLLEYLPELLVPFGAPCQLCFARCQQPDTFLSYPGHPAATPAPCQLCPARQRWLAAYQHSRDRLSLAQSSMTRGGVT